VVYRGQAKNATAGVKALFLTQRRQGRKNFINLFL
jgi:hypothetical protein